MLEHAERPLVPAFTGVHDEHFNARVTKNLPRRAFRRATKQRLSDPQKAVSRMNSKARGNAKFGHNTFQNIDRLVDAYFNRFTHLDPPTIKN